MSTPSAKPLIDDLWQIASDLPQPDRGFSVPERTSKNIFADIKRKAWDTSETPRCDFTQHYHLNRRAGVFFLSLWWRSLKGRAFLDIKTDDAEVIHFADAVAEFVDSFFGSDLASGDWALATTPRRRHKERNFSTLVCERLAPMIGIEFYHDVAFADVGAHQEGNYIANNIPSQRNVIVFDDIVTTGRTLQAMDALLRDYGKNCFYIAAIDNIKRWH